MKVDRALYLLGYTIALSLLCAVVARAIEYQVIKNPMMPFEQWQGESNDCNRSHP